MIHLDGSEYEEWRHDWFAERKRMIVEDMMDRMKEHYRARRNAPDGPKARRRLAQWRARHPEHARV